jgi:NAD(P)-dependent dehydrogenase (short-subunit alcohol dehydrogenase family)
MIDLTDRVAIVTGAGSGLGRSYALALAERGAKVVVNDLGAHVDGTGGDAGPAKAVAEEINDLGGIAVSESSSVATPEGGEAIVGRALDAFGQVDVLVNNAGNIELSSMAKLDVRSMDRILEVHLGGAFYVTQPAYRAMLPRKSGSIIFTTSGVATFGNLGASVYGAAKGGILGLLHVLKLEGARHGIRVNAVAPMAQTRLAADVDLEQYKGVTERSVSPDLVAPAVVYLASDTCELTGEVWSVGSGSVSRLFVGRTEGYFKHPEVEGEMTPEEVAEHIDEIQDLDGFTLPPTWPEEWNAVLDRLQTAQ